MEVKSKKQFKLNKKKYIILISALLICVFVYVGSCALQKLPVNLAQDHIYVCDNPSNDSDFDTWMKENLGLNWVPTYLIVKDDVVIGSIRGGVGETQFTSELGTVLIQNWQLAELPDIPVSDITGNRDSFKNILPNDSNFYIIEISWVTCKDCIFQDENFTQEIYKKYGVNRFYRYYIHSTQEEVLDKYNLRKE